MGKRAKGEGTIFYSAARGKWGAQLPAGADGKRHIKTAATEAEALALLRQMHAERAAGRDLSRRAETVAELLADWLETMQPHVRATTLGYYHACVQNITTRIGKLRAQDVTTELVQRLANDMALAGLGPAYVRATLTRLRAAYERLIPERFPSNPVNWAKLKLRKSVRPDLQPLDALQLQRLLTAADDVETRGGNVRWAVAVWLGALLGLRRGEIFGLTWRDVDLKKRPLCTPPDKPRFIPSGCQPSDAPCDSPRHAPTRRCILVCIRPSSFLFAHLIHCPNTTCRPPDGASGIAILGGAALEHINEALVALGVLIIGSIGTLLTVGVQRIKRDLECNTEMTRQTREAANGTRTTALDRLAEVNSRASFLQTELRERDDIIAYILAAHPEIEATLAIYRDRRANRE